MKIQNFICSVVCFFSLEVAFAEQHFEFRCYNYRLAANSATTGIQFDYFNGAIQGTSLWIKDLKAQFTTDHLAGVPRSLNFNEKPFVLDFTYKTDGVTLLRFESIRQSEVYRYNRVHRFVAKIENAVFGFESDTYTCERM